MTAKYRHQKARELLDQAAKLPRRLLADKDYQDFAGYDADEQKAVQFKERKRARLNEFGELMLTLRSFIKTSYGRDSEYFSAGSEIKYTPEQRGYSLDSFNDGHNRIWSSGRSSLISLLENIVAEEQQRLEMEADLENPSRKTVIRIGITALLGVCLLALWNAPPETMLQVFGKDKIFMARCGLSVSLVPLYLIAFSPKDWIALLSVWATLFVVVMSFLR